MSANRKEPKKIDSSHRTGRVRD